MYKIGLNDKTSRLVWNEAGKNINFFNNSRYFLNFIRDYIFRRWCDRVVGRSKVKRTHCGIKLEIF